MIILGIHDGHNASASLIKDGKLICALGEERLSRGKHHYGYPKRAIQTVMETGGITSKDIDHIAMSTKTLPPAYFYTRRNSTFSIADYWKEQREYWYPKLYEGKDPKYTEIFEDKIDLDQFPYDQSLIFNEKDHEGMWLARIKHLSESLEVNEEIIRGHDHHRCHAYYGYATCPYRDESVLLYTMDGGGDNTNGTVSIGEYGQPLEEISRSSNCNIGRMYRYATLNLNMKPTEHEFKVMGLAGYALKNNAFFGKLENFYSKTLDVKNAKFFYKLKPKDNYFYFKNLSKNIRFDTLAYFIQNFTENILEKWFLQIYEKYKIKNFIFSGGVAQNIKATKNERVRLLLSHAHANEWNGALVGSWSTVGRTVGVEGAQQTILQHIPLFRPSQCSLRWSRIS